MSKTTAEGRPTSGVLLTQELNKSAQRRGRSRDLSPLRALAPYVRRHIGYAIGATLFLLISSGATLGLSGGS